MKTHQFSQQGKRSNNEDSLGVSKGILTVCDGMGGHNYGERASAFVVKNLIQFFEQPQPLNKIEIQQQLTKIQNDLNQLLEQEPELEKMGTTFTGIFLTPDVWYAAHIGDSRIYLFRPSEKKLWHTWDHSLVGELMRTHEITIEAGRFHPMSNRISKAIIAQKNGKPAAASVVKFDELKQGDILLLCSDGVVEAWGDWELVNLLSDNSLSFEQKCEKIAEQCNQKSKDNNTAIIAEIEDQDAFCFGNNEEITWTSFAEVEADYQQYLKDNAEDNPVEDEVNNIPLNRSASHTANIPVNPPAENLMTQPQKIDDDLDIETNDEPCQTKNSLKFWAIIIVLLATIVLSSFFIFKSINNNSGKTNSTKPKTEQQSQNNKNNNRTASTPKQPKGDQQDKDKTTPKNNQTQNSNTTITETNNKKEAELQPQNTNN